MHERVSEPRQSASFPNSRFPRDLVELFPKFWKFGCLVEQMPGKVSFLSAEGERQIPLNEQFLTKCPSADLKPGEILVSVNIPYSRKVRGSFRFLGSTCEPVAC